MKINRTEKTAKKKIERLAAIALFILAITIFFIPISLADIALERATTQTATPYSYYGENLRTYFPSLSDENCKSGQDFFLEIPLTGCSPEIVRSDLLEEQDVPVFCRLVGTKLNPIIEIPYIKSVQIAGQDLNKSDIKSVLFHPAKAALTQPFAGLIGSPQLNDLGYLVVVLKRKATEKEMPDIVTANLTTRITYTYEKSFGVSATEFLLPETDESEWNKEYQKYGFWKGKGYIRAESVDKNQVNLKMYTDADKVFDSLTLKLSDKETEPRYMPGFYCSAGYKLKLNSIDYPQLRAEIDIGADRYIVTKGMEIGNTGCKATSIAVSEYGLGGTVIIKCPDGTYTLTQGMEDVAKLKTTQNGKETIKSYKIGDKLELETIAGTGGSSPNKLAVYFVYALKLYDSTTGKERDLVVLMEIEQGKKVKKIIKEVRQEMKEYLDKNSNDLSKKTDTDITKELNFVLDDQIFLDISNIFQVDIEPHVIVNEGIIQLFSASLFHIPAYSVKIESLPGLLNKQYADVIEDYYNDAVKAYKQVSEDYPNEEDANGVPYGAKALIEAADKAKSIGKSLDEVLFLNELLRKYPDAKLADDAKKRLSNLYNSVNPESASKYIKTRGMSYTFTLAGITEPGVDELSAEISIDEGASQTLGLYDDLSEESDWQISKIEEEKVTFESANSSQVITVEEGAERNFGGMKVKVIKINLKKLARVSIVPWNNNGVTYANFTFNVGIEKRAIQLNPEQTASLITTMDSEIAKWEKTYNDLGKVVKQWKTVCLAGAGTLWLLNTLDTLGTSKTIARNDVMRGTSGMPGMIATCDGLVSKGKYPSTHVCLLDKENEINKRIKVEMEILEEHNRKVDAIEKSPDVINTVQVGIIGGKRQVVDRQKVAEEMQFKIYAPFTGGQGCWKIHGGNCITSEAEANRLKSEGKNLSYEFAEDVTFTDSDGSEKTFTKKEIGGVLGYTSTLYEEGYMHTEEQKELSKLLGLKSACKAGKLSADYCTELNNAFGREMKSLIDAKRNVGTQKSTLNELGSSFSVSLSQLNIVQLEKKTEAVAEIFPDYDKSKLIEKGSADMFKDIKEPKVDIGFFGIESTKYLAIVDRTSGNKYEIKKLYTINADKTIKETTIPDKLSNVITGISKDTCSANNKYTGEMKIRFWETGTSKGMPAFMPLTNVKPGYYFMTTSSLGYGLEAYQESGALNNLWICGVGADGKPNYDFAVGARGDDTGCCFNIHQGMSEDDISKTAGVYGFTKRDVDKVISCVSDAAKSFQAGRKDIGVSCCEDCTIGEPAVASPTTSCEDFMSPSNCNLMYNLCDPVICPTSRCNLGGRYPVDNVIQTGIIGGLTLCLPNMKTDNILVPLCLSGIHAGIDNVLTIMKSTKACLNESLATGRTIGICDQLQSVYLCEMFWRELTPFLKTGIPALVERGFVGGIFGTRKTGGEYRTFTHAWNTAGESAKYIVDYYGAEIFKAFSIRTMAEAGSTVCKQFVSIKYPDAVDLVNQLTEPESPYQVNAFFYETPMTTATVPAMSHYKVYYHLYSGREQGHYYSIYLKNPSSLGSYYNTPEITQVPEASGYMTAGQYVDLAPDFTAPSGYKEICIRIDSKDHCGFGRATTTFGVQEIADLYASNQASQEVSTTEECVSGTAGLVSPSLNIQEMVDESLNPAIYKNGIVRICSSKNPGLGTSPEKWTRIGFCDTNQNIGCWLSEDSVKTAIRDTGLQNKTLTEAEKISKELFDESGYMDRNSAEKVYNYAESLKENMKRQLRDLGLSEQIGKESNDKIKSQIENVIGGKTFEEKVMLELDYLLKFASADASDIKAKAQLQKGAVLNEVVDSFKLRPLQPASTMLFPVYFDYKSSSVDTKKEQEIKTKMLDALKGLSNGRLYVAGYASEEGTESFNNQLSADRAKEVNDVVQEFSNTLQNNKIEVEVLSMGETSEFSEKEKYSKEKITEALNKIESASAAEKAKVASTGDVNSILKWNRVVVVYFDGKADTSTTMTTQQFSEGIQSKSDFYKKVYACLKNEDKKGMSQDFIIAVAAYESNWGAKTIDNNYFNVPNGKYANLCDSLKGFITYINEKYSADISMYSKLMAKSMNDNNGLKYAPANPSWSEGVMNTIDDVASIARYLESGTTTTATTSAEKTTSTGKCVLTSADWVTKSGGFKSVEGDVVGLRVIGKNCVEKSVEFLIKELDSGMPTTGKDAMLKSFNKGDSLAEGIYSSSSAIFQSYGSDERAFVEWNSAWMSDGLIGNPEYAFMAWVFANKEAGENQLDMSAFSTNFLSVLKKQEPKIDISEDIKELQ